jgi:glycosyltransferase involved in cell wall biosynthesis
MKKKYVVSVIILSYNQEKTIVQTLSSIVNQITNFEYEIIIGDDHSSDKTRNICESFINVNTKATITLLHLTTNLGLIKNYQRCILASYGKYIACCAGDDYWIDEHKLQKQVDYLEMNEEYGMVHTNYSILEDTGKILSINFKRDQGYIFDKLLTRNQIGALTSLTKKKLILDAIKDGIYNQNFLMEDYPLWLFVSNKNKIGYLDIVTAIWRKQSESISNSSDKIRAFKFEQSVIDVMLYFARKYGRMHNILDTIEDRNRKQLNYAYANSLFHLVIYPYKNLRTINRLKNRDHLTYIISKLPHVVKMYRQAKKIWSR